MRTRLVILAIAGIFAVPAARAVDGADPTQQFAPDSLGMHSLTMHAELGSMDAGARSDGQLDYVIWSDQYGATRESFGADLLVTVPAKLPGFDNVADAMDADVRVRLSHHGQAYAECRMVADPVVSRHFVSFSFEVAGYNGDAKPVRGVCDVDLTQDGTQIGVPWIDHGVMITAFVRSAHADDCDFAQGYCE